MRRTNAIMALLLAMALPAGAVYQVGDIVDNFILDDTEGVSHALYDYEGKIIVLNFGEWWCGPCNAEWAVMTDGLWTPNKDQGVVILTIGDDEEESFREKADEYGGGWPWLFDHTDALYRDYGNGFIPYNSILDQDFRLLWGDSGWHGNFDEIQNQIDPKLYDVVVHQLSPQAMTVRPGDEVTLDVTLTNRVRGAESIAAFVDVILPGHGLFGGNPMMRQTVNIPANMTGSAPISMNVPLVAPPGTYGVRVGIGESADDPRSSDVMRLTIE